MALACGRGGSACAGRFRDELVELRQGLPGGGEDAEAVLGSQGLLFQEIGLLFLLEVPAPALAVVVVLLVVSTGSLFASACVSRTVSHRGGTHVHTRDIARFDAGKLADTPEWSPLNIASGLGAAGVVTPAAPSVATRATDRADAARPGRQTSVGAHTDACLLLAPALLHVLLSHPPTLSHVACEQEHCVRSITSRASLVCA